MFHFRVSGQASAQHAPLVPLLRDVDKLPAFGRISERVPVLAAQFSKVIAPHVTTARKPLRPISPIQASWYPVGIRLCVQQELFVLGQLLPARLGKKGKFPLTREFLTSLGLVVRENASFDLNFF